MTPSPPGAGRIDGDRGAECVNCARQLEVRAREQVRTPAADVLIDFNGPGERRQCGLFVGRRIGRNRGDEAVSRSRHGLDVRRRSRVVAERLAECGHVDGQDPFFDERFRPNLCQQLVLRIRRPRWRTSATSTSNAFGESLTVAGPADSRCSPTSSVNPPKRKISRVDILRSLALTEHLWSLMAPSSERPVEGRSFRITEQVRNFAN